MPVSIHSLQQTALLKTGQEGEGAAHPDMCSGFQATGLGRGRGIPRAAHCEGRAGSDTQYSIIIGPVYFSQGLQGLKTYFSLAIVLRK